MSVDQNAYISRSTISNLHNNESINSIQIKTNENPNSKLIFSCSDSKINICDTLNQSRKTLFSCDEETNSELNQLKLFKDLLYAANSEYLQIFDVNALKQVGNYKISRDTINSIEINQSNTLIACSDDLGDIKLLDLRAKTLLTNKKVLKKHDNICYCVKFNPSNENELFSGSFDSTILKWDLRSMSCASIINISEVLSRKQEEDTDQNSLVSTMTPCFVHSLCFSNINEHSVLLAGIENGICLAFDTNTCECLTLKQIKDFNCALTSMIKLEEGNLNEKFKNYLRLANTNELFISCGNDLSIEFFYLNNRKNACNSITIEKLNKFKLNHGYKINNSLFVDNSLFVCDTTSDLTVYDLNILSNNNKEVENISNVS